VGVIPEFIVREEEIPENLLATVHMRAPLQPIAATGQKAPESFSLLAGGDDWPPHQQVWGGYKFLSSTIYFCNLKKN